MADNQDLIDYFSKLPEGERKGPASEATLQKLFEVIPVRVAKIKKI